VKRLRTKLPPAANGDPLIRTVRGVGYVIDRSPPRESA